MSEANKEEEEEEEEKGENTDDDNNDDNMVYQQLTFIVFIAMDLFAIVLVTITILTICGICLFIFICALQPKIIRYLHRKKNRTYYIIALKKMNQANSDLYINNLDLTSRLSSTTSIDRDKRAYLKVLERSVRTGRRIQDEKDNNKSNNNNNDTNYSSFYFLRHYINKHLSSSTRSTNIRRSTEI